MGQAAGAECTPEDEDEPRIRVNPTERSLVSYLTNTSMRIFELFFFRPQNTLSKQMLKKYI